MNKIVWEAFYATLCVSSEFHMQEETCRFL